MVLNSWENKIRGKAMKKIMLSSSLLLLGFFIGGHHVLATTATTDKKASVSLTESTEPNASLLEITSASDLNFGSQAIGVDNMIFKDVNSPSITLTDIRGDAPGWNISVSLGEFKTASGNKTLKGVKLFYPYVLMTTTEGAIAVAERQPETIATDSSFDDESVKGVLIESLETPTAKTLMNAISGKGNGQWTANYIDKNQIELYVPTGNLAGDYTASLTYTLTDGPIS